MNVRREYMNNWEYEDFVDEDNMEDLFVKARELTEEEDEEEWDNE